MKDNNLTIPEKDFNEITSRIDNTIVELQSVLKSKNTTSIIEEQPDDVFTIPIAKLGLLYCPNCNDSKIELLSDSRTLKTNEEDYARCVICSWNGPTKELLKKANG